MSSTTVVDLVRELAKDAPSWLRVLVTSRPGEAVEKLRSYEKEALEVEKWRGLEKFQFQMLVLNPRSQQNPLNLIKYFKQMRVMRCVVYSFTS